MSLFQGVTLPCSHTQISLATCARMMAGNTASAEPLHMESWLACIAEPMKTAGRQAPPYASCTYLVDEAEVVRHEHQTAVEVLDGLHTQEG